MTQVTRTPRAGYTPEKINTEPGLKMDLWKTIFLYIPVVLQVTLTGQ